MHQSIHRPRTYVYRLHIQYIIHITRRKLRGIKVCQFTWQIVDGDVLFSTLSSSLLLKWKMRLCSSGDSGALKMKPIFDVGSFPYGKYDNWRRRAETVELFAACAVACCIGPHGVIITDARCFITCRVLRNDISSFLQSVGLRMQSVDTWRII